MKFTKMQGCGNDYVYIDCFREAFPEDAKQRGALVRRLSDRHFGIGGDGVIFICPSESADARMRMFNADGSESAMCGNGVRCVAKYVFDRRLVSGDEIRIETEAGEKIIHVAEVQAGCATRLRVDMGEPILSPREIPATVENNVRFTISATDKLGNQREFQATAVSMGNPHCVIFVDKITDEMVFHFGPQLEHHPFFPERANIEFIERLASNELRMRVWERGTGETLACGTGASAVCVAGVLIGATDRAVRIHLPGGDLDLEWDETSRHVFMTGPAVEVFTGEIS
ncbi:MAG: diaminopimelate epimerase [Planctomycetia bacterium]|nr:diaminopimelate epimerase [Planctomycetia bacterium]